MLSFTTLLVAILATYRLTRLLVVDDGLWRLFFKLRLRLGVYDLATNNEPKTQLGRLLSCMYCTGIWVAMPVALLLFGLEQWYMFLAVAGGQAVLVDYYLKD